MCVVMFECSHQALIILTKYSQNNPQCQSHVSQAAGMVATLTPAGFRTEAVICLNRNLC